MNKKLHWYRFISQFKDKYSTLYSADEFELPYADYLMKYHGVTQDDLEDYFKVLETINYDNYLEKFQCHIVDKLMDVTDVQQYEKTAKEIAKTQLQVELKLVGHRIDPIVYESD